MKKKYEKNLSAVSLVISNLWSLVEKPMLNKSKIEGIIGATLNPTDWKILNELFNNPALGNKDLADKVSLSVEGTRSSLGKMYRHFNIKTARNQRFILVMEAVKASNQED